MELTSEFLLAVVAVTLAGVVRGFSGFGAGMVLVPTLSILYNPVVAVLTVVLLEFIPSIQLLPQATRNCDWRSIAPISIAVVITIPIGSWVLVYTDPDVLRILIASLLIFSVLVLSSGWRFPAEFSNKTAVSTGAVSGLLSGAMSLGGLPIILYFLSGKFSAETARASMVVFLLFTAFVSLGTYSLHGLFDSEIVIRTAWLIPPFILAIGLGGYLFNKVPERLFRNLTLSLLGGVALFMLFS